MATDTLSAHSDSVPAAPRTRPWVWVQVGVAALLMVATLPGRTHGLGLFTEPILRTFQLDRLTYANINLWSTLLGAAFCLPCGWLLDRFGIRVALLLVMLPLSGAVLGLGAWTGGMIGFALLILLTRGFGQSALSVVSLALIGHAAGRRSGWTMGVYSCLVTIGFIAAFTVLREVIGANPDEWRAPWSGIGVGVLIAAILSALLVCPSALNNVDRPEPSRCRDATLVDALRSRTFWAFAIGTSFYGMVAAGISLFNESILAERGLSKSVFLDVTLIGIPVGLAANLIGGWMATRVGLGRLCGGALVLYGVCLGVYPLVETEWHAYLYASGLAAAGGVITVCFFIVWRREFGVGSLGRIQGAAQLLTVLFSAIGPRLFASAQESWFGAYAPLFTTLMAASFLLALCCWFAPIRSPREEGVR